MVWRRRRRWTSGRSAGCRRRCPVGSVFGCAEFTRTPRPGILVAAACCSRPRSVALSESRVVRHVCHSALLPSCMRRHALGGTLGSVVPLKIALWPARHCVQFGACRAELHCYAPVTALGRGCRSGNEGVRSQKEKESPSSSKATLSARPLPDVFPRTPQGRSHAFRDPELCAARNYLGTRWQITRRVGPVSRSAGWPIPRDAKRPVVSSQFDRWRSSKPLKRAASVRRFRCAARLRRSRLHRRSNCLCAIADAGWRPSARLGALAHFLAVVC